ncbi:hypothetical protein [Nonomuraea candida]|uniref:hypothetical protein n=1 Tax=Nonomuraea candida TaxID=359159 RepID=UPI0005BDD834|nr:hypothetical protein [Nonomuraea candida]
MTGPDRPAPATGPQPRDLMSYATWLDEEGYHALLYRRLPPDAIEYGCLQQVWATTEEEMRRAAAQNQIKIWEWEEQA